MGKMPDGRYEPFIYKRSLSNSEVEVSDDVFLITREHAEQYVKARESGAPTPTTPGARSGGAAPGGVSGATQGGPTPEFPGVIAATVPASGVLAGFRWSGELPAQKWMNFYTKVLSRFATGDGMKLTVTVDVTPAGGVPKSKVDETRVALRELGLPEVIRTTESDS